MNKIIALTISLLLFPVLLLAQTETTSPTLVEIKALQKQAGDLLSPTSIRRNSISEYLKVQFSPQSPKPGETVSVTAESFLSDLNKATIAWSVNGKTIERGIGKKSFSFQVGASGETTKLAVWIITNQGEEVYKEYGFNPIGLSLLWEADTYTPPFYKGKPLASYQSRVRAIAVSDTANIAGAFNASTLSYVWKKDGYALSDASGYGRNSYTFTAPRPYEQVKIGVSASPLSGSANSEFLFKLPIASPFILFYEKHPLLGIRYEHPLDEEFTLAGKDVTIAAEPFFFSQERSETPIFSYTWLMNGKTINNFGRSITLRNETGGKGESSISLGMYGTKKTFQSASQSLRIKFGESEDASF